MTRRTFRTPEFDTTQKTAGGLERSHAGITKGIMSFWLYWKADQENQTILASTTGTEQLWYKLNGQIRMRWAGTDQVSATGVLTADTWQHIFVRFGDNFDGGNNDVELLIDGSRVLIGLGGSSPEMTSAFTLWLWQDDGADNDMPDETFDFILDDVDPTTVGPTDYNYSAADGGKWVDISQTLHATRAIRADGQTSGDATKSTDPNSNHLTQSSGGGDCTLHLTNVPPGANPVESATGTAIQTLEEFTQLAVGVMHPSGVAAQTVEEFTQLAAGAAPHIGSVAQALEEFVQLAEGIEKFIGSSAQQLELLTQLASGARSGGAIQVLRPDADQASGSWTNTPLWPLVDDDAIAGGDGAEIQSETVGDGVNTSFADIRLSNVSDPEVSTGHTLRVLWKRNQTEAKTLAGHCELWQGVPGVGTKIASIDVTPDVGTTKILVELTLSGAEADSITDYIDLYLRLWGRGTASGTARWLQVDACEFEVPAAPAGTGLGTVEQTLELLVQTAVGEEKFIGSIAQVLEEFTQLSSGSHTTNTTGEAAQTLELLVQVAAGLELFIGTSEQTLELFTQVSSGAAEAVGSAAQTLELITQLAAGVELFTGTAEQVLELLTQVSSGSHIEGAIGTAEQTLELLTQVVAGIMHPSGTVAQTLELLTQLGTGELQPSGVAIQILEELSQSGVGTAITADVGTVEQTLELLIQAAVGLVLAVWEEAEAVSDTWSEEGSVTSGWAEEGAVTDGLSEEDPL